MTDDWHCPIDHEYLAEDSGLDLCPNCGDLLPGYEDEISVRLVPSLLPSADDGLRADGGGPASGGYRFPDLDGEDVFYLNQLEKLHGKARVIGWLRGKTAVPLRYQFEEDFDEDDYFEAMRERYVDTATEQQEARDDD